MIKKLRQVKEVRVATWQMFNAAMAGISAIWMYYATNSVIFSWLFLTVIVPLLNMFTKYVNTTIFNDLWVN